MKKLLFILTLFFVNYSIAQTIGSKVSIVAVDGKTYTGVITDIQGGKYKVRYDGYDFDSWLTAPQFKVLQSSPPIPNNSNQAAKGSTMITQENTVGEKYGTREPRICGETRAPLRGAITAELATKYFMCQAEKESSDYLYLVEDVKIQVGGGIPYSAIMGQRSLHEIDVTHPVYPVRGTYTRYQYRRIYEKGQKPYANVYNEKANGYCYKTTFGDWQCRF